VRPPHSTENEACCVWKNAAVKQPSVRSLPFKTKRFIPAVKNPLRFQTLVRAILQSAWNPHSTCIYRTHLLHSPTIADAKFGSGL
jgi:hypothetical protein